MTINADGSCGGGWVCEHRWNAIAKMVRFRNAVADTASADYLNYYNDGNTVSFSRGNKGFFAMTKGGSLDQTLSTGNESFILSINCLIITSVCKAIDFFY